MASNTTSITSIGIDIDGTITENIEFFRTLSTMWPGNVYIITYRDNLERTKNELDGYGIQYTDVILVKTFAEKAAIIKHFDIKVYFDDMDEVITHIPEDVTVMKVRNGGNFNDGKWAYDSKTGYNIDSKR